MKAAAGGAVSGAVGDAAGDAVGDAASDAVGDAAGGLSAAEMFHGVVQSQCLADLVEDSVVEGPAAPGGVSAEAQNGQGGGALQLAYLHTPADADRSKTSQDRGTNEHV